MEKQGNDDDERRANSIRVVNEYDFFDDKRSGAKHIYLLPALAAPLKEIIFPQILNSPAEASDDDEAMDIDSHSRTDPIPPRFLERIVQDDQVVLLFEKKLEVSDVARKQNQLVISGSERVMAALTEEERGRVEREGFLEVTTIDQRENEYTMRLKDMGGTSVVGHEWFKLVSANQLEEGDSVQGWGYRAPDNFRLAIAYARNF